MLTQNSWHLNDSLWCEKFCQHASYRLSSFLFGWVSMHQLKVSHFEPVRILRWKLLGCLVWIQCSGFPRHPTFSNVAPLRLMISLCSRLFSFHGLYVLQILNCRCSWIPRVSSLSESCIKITSRIRWTQMTIQGSARGSLSKYEFRWIKDVIRSGYRAYAGQLRTSFIEWNRKFICDESFLWQECKAFKTVQLMST